MPLGNVRRQFPIFSRRIHGYPLAYLDSAATTQKPNAVLRAMDTFYRRHYANTRRGLYQLSLEASAMVEAVRREVADFIGAADPAEVIFTSGTTAAINLVAGTWAATHLRRGDTIVLSELEHHSNLVPWQQLAKRRGLKLSFLPITRTGELQRPVRLPRGIKLVAVTHTSNALGTCLPLPAIIRAAHRVGARVLVDAAQAVAHQPVSVRRLGCDWLAFSGHKLYGPTGIGVLWGRWELLEAAPPFLFGGEMIREVSWQSTTFAALPAKYEAGTVNIAGIIGLGAAIRFTRSLGWARIAAHERQLTRYTLQRLRELPGVTLYGPLTAGQRAGIISFNLAGIHPHDVAAVLDRFGIAVRAGHHCAMPLMSRLGVPATVRVSFGVYNTLNDVDRLVAGLKQVQKIFGLPEKAQSAKRKAQNTSAKAKTF